MFLSTEPSTLGYQEKNKTIIPLYGKKDNNENNIKNIIKIQTGAKNFINDANKNKIDNLLTDILREDFPACGKRPPGYPLPHDR